MKPVVVMVTAALILGACSAPDGGTESSSDDAGAEQTVRDDDIIDVVAKDAIPAVDDPRFLPAGQPRFLAAREPVVVVEIDDDARAYPLQIMTWHEIVNDVVGGVPIVVTFCPLCNTAVAYERPEIDGDVTTFGVSGSLLHSNLLMYDRTTDSLWPQATGVAIKGEMTGTELRRIPAPIVAWGEFVESFPEGQVLSRDTGHERPYGRNPYPGYDDVDRPPFLFRGEVDGRLAAVERVLGVENEGRFVAFPYFRLEAHAEDGLAAVNADIGGLPILVTWRAGTTSALDGEQIAQSRDVGAAAAFDRRVDGKTLTFEVRAGRIVDLDGGSEWNAFGRAVAGPREGTTLERVDAIDSFWFDWAAFHPDTDLWRTEED